MAYSVLDDIQAQISEAELIQLTDDVGGGVIDNDVIDRAISDADEEIDGYIGSRMTVPLTTVPGIVRKASIDIAIFNLYSRRQDSAPDMRKERYKTTVRLLEKIAEGKITLGQADPEGNPPEKAGISYDALDQVMTDDKLGRF
jgi:phage gp36-like protein